MAPSRAKKIQVKPAKITPLPPGLIPRLLTVPDGLFRRLASGGMTLLVSSHVMDEAERCDELLVLRDGRLLAQGAPAALQDSTRTRDMNSAFLALVAASGREAA